MPKSTRLAWPSRQSALRWPWNTGDSHLSTPLSSLRHEALDRVARSGCLRDGAPAAPALPARLGVSYISPGEYLNKIVIYEEAVSHIGTIQPILTRRG